MNKEVFLVSKDKALIKLIRETIEPPGYILVLTERLELISMAISSFETDLCQRIILIDSSYLSSTKGGESSELLEDLGRKGIVYLLTDREGKALALNAMRKGVYGYLEKPLDPEELVITIERIIGPPDNPEVLSSVRSSKMKKVLRDLKNLSEDDLPVIISGDEGVDRGYYARILHFQGKRRGNLFFSPDLNKRGPEWLKLLKDSPEDIRGGSLFIDRINSLDTWVWKDLEDITRITDVRLMGGIEGTLDNVNEPLRQSIIRLFGEREMRIPPVKERKEDILLIMDYLIDKMERRFRQGKKRLSKEARSYALKYHWPGNDRELEETIMKAYIFSKGEVIDKKDLFAGDMSLFPLEEFLSLRLKGLIKENSNLYHAVIGEVEKALIGIVLHEVEGNQLKASRILGINRNTLRSKIKDLNLNGRI